MKDKLSSILYIVAGILFFIAAIIGRNFVFIPIGACFVILGIVDWKKKKIDQNSGTER